MWQWQYRSRHTSWCHNAKKCEILKRHVQNKARNDFAVWCWILYGYYEALCDLLVMHWLWCKKVRTSPLKKESWPLSKSPDIQKWGGEGRLAKVKRWIWFNPCSGLELPCQHPSAKPELAKSSSDIIIRPWSINISRIRGWWEWGRIRHHCHYDIYGRMVCTWKAVESSSRIPAASLKRQPAVGGSCS